MKEQLEQLIEKSRKENLSQEERILLERLFDQDPALRKDWEEECRLTALFSLLPDAPLSSDFTEQVLKQTFDVEAPQKSRLETAFVYWSLFSQKNRWLKYAAAACLVFLLSFGFYHHQSQVRIHQMAESLSTVAETATEVAVVSEVDLNAIHVLGKMTEATSVDNDLWVAMVSY